MALYVNSVDSVDDRKNRSCETVLAFQVTIASYFLSCIFKNLPRRTSAGALICSGIYDQDIVVIYYFIFSSSYPYRRFFRVSLGSHSESNNFSAICNLALIIILRFTFVRFSCGIQELDVLGFLFRLFGIRDCPYCSER